MTDLMVLKQKILTVDTVFTLISEKNAQLKSAEKNCKSLLETCREEREQNEALRREATNYKDLYTECTTKYLETKNRLDREEPRWTALEAEHARCRVELLRPGLDFANRPFKRFLAEVGPMKLSDAIAHFRSCLAENVPQDRFEDAARKYREAEERLREVQKDNETYKCRETELLTCIEALKQKIGEMEKITKHERRRKFRGFETNDTDYAEDTYQLYRMHNDFSIGDVEVRRIVSMMRTHPELIKPFCSRKRSTKKQHAASIVKSSSAYDPIINETTEVPELATPPTDGVPVFINDQTQTLERPSTVDAKTQTQRSTRNFAVQVCKKSSDDATQTTSSAVESKTSQTDGALAENEGDRRHLHSRECRITIRKALVLLKNLKIDVTIRNGKLISYNNRGAMHVSAEAQRRIEKNVLDKVIHYIDKNNEALPQRYKDVRRERNLRYGRKISKFVKKRADLNQSDTDSSNSLLYNVFAKKALFPPVKSGNEQDSGYTSDHEQLNTRKTVLLRETDESSETVKISEPVNPCYRLGYEQSTKDIQETVLPTQSDRSAIVTGDSRTVNKLIGTDYLLAYEQPSGDTQETVLPTETEPTNGLILVDDDMQETVLLTDVPNESVRQHEQTNRTIKIPVGLSSVPVNEEEIEETVLPTEINEKGELVTTVHHERKLVDSGYTSIYEQSSDDTQDAVLPTVVGRNVLPIESERVDRPIDNSVCNKSKLIVGEIIDMLSFEDHQITVQPTENGTLENTLHENLNFQKTDQSASAHESLTKHLTADRKPVRNGKTTRVVKKPETSRTRIQNSLKRLRRMGSAFKVRNEQKEVLVLPKQLPSRGSASNAIEDAAGSDGEASCCSENSEDVFLMLEEMRRVPQMLEGLSDEDAAQESDTRQSIVNPSVRKSEDDVKRPQTQGPIPPNKKRKVDDQPCDCPSDPPRLCSDVKEDSNLSFDDFTNIFKRLVRFKGVEKHVDIAVKVFIKLDVNRLISYLLREVANDRCEREKGRSPFEPYLSVPQKTVLGLLMRLEAMYIPNVVESFLAACERHLLFHERDPFAVEHVTRVYAAVCKAKRLKARLRRTIADGMYFMGDLVVPLTFYICTTWVQVLKRCGSDELDEPLVQVLVQIVHTRPKTSPEYCVCVLRNLLQVYYKYPRERYNENNLMKEFLEQYICTLSANHEVAMLILCKIYPDAWAYKQLRLIKEITLISTDRDTNACLLDLMEKISTQFKDKSVIEKSRELLAD